MLLERRKQHTDFFHNICTLLYGLWLIVNDLFSLDWWRISLGLNSDAEIPPNFPKDVLDNLKCPVCEEFAIPPIKLCKTGHIICLICREKEDKCSVCGEGFTNTRNFALENIVSALQVKCT